MPIQNTLEMIFDIALFLFASVQFGTYVLTRVSDAVPDNVSDDVSDAVPARRSRRARASARPRARPRPRARAPAAARRATSSVFIPPEPHPCRNTTQPEPSLTESLKEFFGILLFDAFDKIKNVIETMGLQMDIFRMLVEDSVEQIHNRFPEVDWKNL